MASPEIPFRWSLFDAYLDPVRGSEQRGRRPVLVVSNEDFNQAMPNLTVLPLTSAQRELYPSEVMLPSGMAGQPLDSIVLAHQVRTISKERLGARVGFLNDPDARSAIEAALRDHFDLD